VKPTLSILLLAGAALAPLSALAQEAAGRVLTSVGDVAIVRGGQRIAAPAGTQVRAGDSLQLGAQSSAQVRFTDESIVALRPDTEFKVSEYQFNAQDSAAGRAFFSLLKGGMRTVTGLIGRRNQANYGVTTLTSTIGIRGTHYVLVECAGNCLNANGSTAANGTYGAVTDGRIGVTNQAGERVFGANEFFHVPSPSTLPQPLLAPPSFVNIPRPAAASGTAAAGAGTGTQGQGAATPSNAVAQTGPNGYLSGDSTTSSTPPGPVQITQPGTSSSNLEAPASSSAATATDSSGGGSASTSSSNQFSTQGPATVVAQSFTGTVFYRLSGPMNIPVSCTNPPCSTVTSGEITLGVNYALQRATVGVAIRDNTGGILNVSTPSAINGVPITISGNQVTFSGSLNRADFPENQGSFRCNDCGPGNVPGYVDRLSFSGTISGSQANLTLSATDPSSSGTINATLSQTTPPNSSAAALATPRNAVPGNANTPPNPGSGTDARSASYWNVQLDGAGRLLQFGPSVGGPAASVGGATNTIAGTAPSAGNLVWGTWTNGTTAGTKATVTDQNYNTFQPANNLVQPWITGDAVNSLPQSLGSSVTYAMVGSVLSNPTSTVNSASLTADFVNRTLALNINATNVSAGNVFQMIGTTGFSPTNSRFSAGFDSATCAGPCNGGQTPSGSYGGFFAGSQAQGAGLVFSTGFGGGTGGITGAIGFRR
jgi:hypothetical protein